MRTLIKHILAATEPKEAVTVKGWVRTRRDSEGVLLPRTQRRLLPRERAGGRGCRHARLGALAQAHHGRLGGGRGQAGGLAGAGPEMGTAGHAGRVGRPGGRRRIRCRRRATRRSSCAPSRICVRARTSSGPCSACAAGWRSRCISSSRSATSSMCIRRSSPRATARARARCSASPPSRATSTRSREADFFGKPAYLTVSGQLEGETFACALSNIYTFGPTFRAENSNTARHAAEFWMIEPEMAFCDLQGDMDLAEEFIKAMARYALEHCAEDLALFAKFVDKGLHERLKFVVERPFVRVPYTEAVDILKQSGKQFEFPVEYGPEPAIRARAVPDRGAFQVPGDGLQLPARDQTVLHAAERRRQDRHGDGRAGAGDRRSHRRRATRGAARATAPRT